MSLVQAQKEMMMSRIVKLALVAIATTVTGAALSHVARAEDASYYSTKVLYRDLNLGTDDGARLMLGRIRHAAKQLCGPQPGDALQTLYVYKPCVDQTIDRAVARLGSSRVAVLNGGKASPATMELASDR